MVCDRLQELQVSSTSTLANMERMQTKISIAMKKIKELSEAVLKSGSLEDLRDKIAVTNEKLEELQNGGNVTGALSSLQSEVVVIKKEVEELSTKLSNNGKLMELQKVIPKLENLQGLQKEVAGIKKNLQKLQKAISSLEKRKSGPDVPIYDDRGILELIEQVEWQLRLEVSNIRVGFHRDRIQMQNQFRPYVERLGYYMVTVAFLCAAMVWLGCDFAFVKKETLQEFQQKYRDDLIYKTHFLQEESNCKTEKFVWSFTNFNSRFWQAKTGSKLCFFSEPFFIEPYGYKMSIAICPNGNPVQNTHLSVFVYLLRGNNDDLLPWPFQKKVVFILVDQQDDLTLRKNINAAIYPKKMPHSKESAFAKPKRSSYRNAKGFGYNNFISHVDLQKRLYIRDDAILVQLEVYPMHCDKQ